MGTECGRVLYKHVWVGLVMMVCLIPAPVLAHEGPPFPLLVDQRIGPCVISVWADPDVGDGTFFIIPSGPSGESLPQDLRIQIGVQPASGRLSEVVYPAERETLRDQVQFKSVVKFDAQEMWRVRIALQSSLGSGESLLSVEATPPGYGRWDLLIYLLPFLAVGFLWCIAIIRKRRLRA